MAADVQDLVDDLAAQLGRPVSLEDRRWRLLAYSALSGPEDRVRQASILTRVAPPEVVAWLATLELPAAGPLVDTPANPAIGMGPRLCAPVRHDGVLLGFLWVIPGDAPLRDDERAAVVDAAAAVGAVLRRRQGAAAAERRETERLVASVLDPDDPVAREAAAEALRARRGWDRSARIAVAIGAVPPGGADEPDDVGARAERRWHAGELAWRSAGPRIVALAPTGDAGALARALHRAGAAHAGAAGASGLGAAHAARAAAEDALLVCAARPELGPAAADAELGAWPAAARLWDAAGRPDRPALLAPLRDRRDAGELVAALEAVLDRAGDVAAAAGALHVHRATLYRRIARAEELLGIDLARGDDVLRAHLAVRALRLAEGLRPGPAPARAATRQPRTPSTDP